MPPRQTTKRANKRQTLNTDLTQLPGSQQPNAPSLTPYILKNEEVERALLTGAHAELLEDYFGKEQMAALQRLASKANSHSVRGGDRVLILPGIMGSTLGFPREYIWNDVIWVDPLDIAIGKLSTLSLGEGGVKGIKALGVIFFAYSALKYRLRIAGFDANFHPFDWRQTIPSLGR